MSNCHSTGLKEQHVDTLLGPEAKGDKGPGSKEDGKPKDDKAKGETAPKDQAKKDTSVTKKEKTEEGKGGKDGKEEKGEKEKKKEPAREKVKIDPKSLALLGKPLGTLLPFLESEEIERIPVENLEFTYCEEKNSNFLPPGLRLEIDVLLKNSLQWATDGLHKILGDQRTPKKVLSVPASGKRGTGPSVPKSMTLLFASISMTSEPRTGMY